MPHTVEVQFFNTFILRSESVNNIHIEESRIKGGFNEDFVSIGPKAHLVNENYAENRRSNALIYSGIYNSRTEINRTNVFSAGEKITRAVNPADGAIEKLFAEDTNLNILQQDKVSYALIDKDALFTAEGGRLTASGAAVIGQIVPYLGKYGTQNAESFSFKGNRKYFADKNRGAVLRLSRDGLTEISNAGMRDYFKDTLKLADKIVGAYDDASDTYVISLQGAEIDVTNNSSKSGFDTLAYDESTKGWTSFYNYKPDFGFSLNKDFFTISSDNIWKHYSNEGSNAYNSFYGFNFPSTITFVSNTDPSMVKNFNTINYEGDANWRMQSSETDLGMKAFKIYGNNETSQDGSSTALSGDILPRFVKKENKYYAHLMNNGTITAVKGQVTGDAGLSLNPSGIKGFFTTVKMQNSTTENEVELFVVSHNIVQSS